MQLMKITTLALIFGALTGCTDEPNAQRILKGQGYTSISTTGHDWFSCGEGDSVTTGFSAKGPTGQRVNGVVCCGWIMKSCTVRID